MFSYSEETVRCIEEGTCPDAITFLAHLGRFDLASFLLLVVSIMLAVGGVIAYFNFRRIARSHASKEAQAIAKVEAERVANEYLQSELPEMFREYRELMEGSATDQDANAIANAQD